MEQTERKKSNGAQGIVQSGRVLNAASEYGADSSTIYNEDAIVVPHPIVAEGKRLEYIPWGYDNKLPFEIIKKVQHNMVMSQNQLFNMLTCYGQGVRFFDTATDKKTKNQDILDFSFDNNLSQFFMEQILDMKYFFFAVACVILDKKGGKIVRIVHKEACYCRFTKANKRGRIEYVLYANWRNDAISSDDIEVIPLLDVASPLTDLKVRLGQIPDPRTGKEGRMTIDRKFAILVRFPTPGYQYYPMSPIMPALFDAWYDIYMMIGIGKRAKIRNSASPRYQVEINEMYWEMLFDQENITDEEAQKKRKEKALRDINDFVMGVENSGKTWITPYTFDQATGKEIHYVTITPIGAGMKEGGDWSDDVQEAANSLCYGTNVHPNLVGATPGKSAMNNSGSDKRELFLLKQATETALHDLLLMPYRLLIRFNQWKGVDVDVPMIVLTTLDENKEKKTVKPNENGQGNEDKGDND